MALPSFFTMLIQPVWGTLSDRFLGRTRTFRLVIFLSSLTMLFFSVAFQLGEFPLLLAAACLLLVCIGSTHPLITAIILSYLGSRRRHLFGRIRAAGSLSFCLTIFFLCPLMVILSRKMQWCDRTGVFLLGSVLYLLTLFFTRWDENQFERHHKPELHSFLTLLKNRSLLFLFLSIFFTAAGSWAGIQYIGPYIGHSGRSEYFFSSLWLVGVGVEIVLTFYMAPIVRRMGLKNTIVLGITAEAIRWLGMSIASSSGLILFFFSMHGPAVLGVFFRLLHLSRFGMRGEREIDGPGTDLFLHGRRSNHGVHCRQCDCDELFHLSQSRSN